MFLFSLECSDILCADTLCHTHKHLTHTANILCTACTKMHSGTRIHTQGAQLVHTHTQSIEMHPSYRAQGGSD